MNRISSAPGDHFTASPDRRMIAAHQGTEGSRDPTICGGIVSPACVQSSLGVKSAKDDHFAAGPDRSVAVSGGGHVDRACRSPGVCRGSVPSAAIQIAAVGPAPDNHFTAGPECRVEVSCDRRVGQISSCPGIVSALNVFGNLWKSVRRIC